MEAARAGTTDSLKLELGRRTTMPCAIILMATTLQVGHVYLLQSLGLLIIVLRRGVARVSYMQELCTLGTSKEWTDLSMDANVERIFGMCRNSRIMRREYAKAGLGQDPAVLRHIKLRKLYPIGRMPRYPDHNFKNTGHSVTSSGILVLKPAAVMSSSSSRVWNL